MGKSFAFLLLVIFLSIQEGTSQASTYFKGDSTYLIFSKNNKKGIRKSDGQTLIPAMYDDIGWSGQAAVWKSGYIGYKTNNKWGIMDSAHTKLTSARFDALKPFQSGDFIIAEKGKFSQTLFYGLVDETGSTLVDKKYYVLNAAGDYLIAASKRENEYYYGVINKKGKVEVPFNYYTIRYLGANIVELNQKNGGRKLLALDKKIEMPDQVFDSVSTFKDGVAVVFRDGQQGLIREDGRLLLEPTYKNIDWNGGKNITVTEYPQWDFLSEDNTLIKQVSADSAYLLNDTVLVRLLNNYTIIQHFTTDSIIFRTPDQLVDIFEQQFVFKKANGQYEIREAYEKEAYYQHFDSAWIKNGYLLSRKNHFHANEWIIRTKSRASFKADSIAVRGGLVAYKEGEYWGVLSTDLTELIPPVYNQVVSIDAAIQQAIVRFRGRYGVVDFKNEWVIPPKYIDLTQVEGEIYHAVDPFLAERLVTKSSAVTARMHYLVGAHAVIETSVEGEVRLVDFQGNALSRFFKGVYKEQNNKFLLFKTAGGYSLYDQNGQLYFSDVEADSIGLVEEGFFPVFLNGAYGFVDKNGKLRIANRYNAVKPFSEGRAAVKIRNSWGFVDVSESLIVQPYFQEVNAFKDGLSVVKMNNRYGIVNTSGDYMMEAKFHEVKREGEYFMVKKGHEYGIANMKGDILVYPNYSSLEVLPNASFKVTKYQKVGVVSNEAVSIIPFKYDELYWDVTHQLYGAKSVQRPRNVYLSDILSSN